MSLNEIWFGLFLLVIAGYLILDGFDMGVGILHFLLAKDDTERRVMLNSIGPVWDGNEVWLVIGGGVLYYLGYTKDKAATVAVVPTRNGGTFTVGWKF